MGGFLCILTKKTITHQQLSKNIVFNSKIGFYKTKAKPKLTTQPNEYDLFFKPLLGYFITSLRRYLVMLLHSYTLRSDCQKI